MQQNSARGAKAKAARIDRRPVIAFTAISILACLLIACQIAL